MDVHNPQEGVVVLDDPEKSLVTRLIMRMPSTLMSIKVSSSHPQYEEHMAAFAAAAEQKISEPFSILRIDGYGFAVQSKFDSDASTDEGSLSRLLQMCLLMEGGETDIGKKAAIRAYRHLAMYQTRDPVEFHWSSAHAFLQRWGKENGHQDLGDDRKARQCLGQAFHKHVTELYRKLTSYKTAEHGLTMSIPFETEAKDGMLWCDALLFDLYEKLGPMGQKDAATYRDRARKRWQDYKKTVDATHAWRFWCDFTTPNDLLEKDIGGGPLHRSHFDEVLLEIIWNDIVKQEWERQKYDFPHLTHGSLSTIIPALRPGNNVVVESMQNDNAKKLVLYTAEGRLIAETSAIRAVADSAITMIRTGAEILSSTLGIMLTVHEVAGFWNRYYSSGKDWQSWAFESYEELCRTFKLDYHKHGTSVRQIIHAQANMDFIWPDGSVGPMIALTERPGLRKTKRPVLTANYPITPRYSWDIERAVGDSRTSRDARWKIPLPDPSEFPDVVGRRNEEAEQKVLFLVMMSKIAENARAGDLILSEEDWDHCADEAGVSTTLASKTLQGWLTQDHLVKVKPGGWWLGDRQARLAEIIREGYVIADRGRKGLPPPRKRRKGGRSR